MTLASVRTPLALLVETIAAFAAVALFVQLFGQDDGPAPSLIAVAAAVVGSYFLAQFLRPVEGADDAGAADPTLGVIASVIAVAGIVAVTYAVAQPDFAWLSRLFEDPVAAVEANGHVVSATVVLFAVWVLGIRRGSAPSDDAAYVLGVATIGLIAVILAAATDPPVQGGGRWAALALAYGILAVAALAVFRARADASLSAFAGPWTLVLTTLAAGAVVVAITAGSLGDALATVADPLSRPFEAVGIALRDYVLAPIIVVIAAPIRLFFALLEWIAGSNDREFEPPPVEPPVEQDDDEGNEPLWLRVLIAVLSGVGFFAVAAVALFVLWRAFQRLLFGTGTDQRDRHEDLEPASSLTADIASMFGALGRRLRRSQRPASAIAIRRLYADVMRAAADRGLQHAPSQTPLQLAPRLDALFSSTAPSAITDAFVDSRYGERAIDGDRVRSLRARFDAECSGAQ